MRAGSLSIIRARHGILPGRVLTSGSASSREIPGPWEHLRKSQTAHWPPSVPSTELGIEFQNLKQNKSLWGDTARRWDIEQMTGSGHADTGRGQCGQEARPRLSAWGRDAQFKQMALVRRLSVVKYMLFYLSSYGMSTFCLHLYAARMVSIVLGICFCFVFSYRKCWKSNPEPHFY